MVITDKSLVITFAIPVFFLLILIEYIYGKYVGKNTYRLNDTFTSISIGMISRYPTMLNLGFQSAVFIYISSNLNLNMLSNLNPVTWILAFLMYDLSYYWLPAWPVGQLSTYYLLSAAIEPRAQKGLIGLWPLPHQKLLSPSILITSIRR